MKAVGVFIVKDLQPYSVVTDVGLCHLMEKCTVLQYPLTHTSAVKLCKTLERKRK